MSISNLFNIPIAVQAAPENHFVQPIHNNTDVKSLLNLFDETPVVQNPEVQSHQVLSVVKNPEPVKQVAPALMSWFSQTVVKEEPVQKSAPVLMSLFSQTMQPIHVKAKPDIVVKAKPAPVVVKEEPAPVVVKEAPAPVVVKEAPAPAPVVVKEEPAPATVVVKEALAPVHRLSSILNNPSPVQTLSVHLSNSVPAVKSVSDDAVNTIKIHKIKNDEPKINEPEIPIRIIKIDVPNQKPVVHATEPEPKPTKIKIVKIESDKPDIEKRQEIKFLKIQTPKIEIKESVKSIEPLPQQQNPEVQNKLNQLELQNKLLAQKLAETTAAYAHACQQNKNLAIALSMRR